MPGEDVLIGYLTIERGSGAYSFVAAGELAGMRVIPPNLFELEPEEISRELKSTYAGHDALPWMRRLSFVARNPIKQGKYPQRYPRG